MARKCVWREGCTTILSTYNNSDLCSVHQKAEAEEFFKGEQKKIEIKERKVQDTHKLTRTVEISKNGESCSFEVSVQTILATVCSSYQIRIDDLLSRKRPDHIAFPRQVAAYLLRIDANRSFPKIANDLKRDDHTTVLYAYRKIQKLRTINIKFDQNIELIRSHYISLTEKKLS